MVHFPLKKEYFEAIKNGEKNWEFRSEKKWRKRVGSATQAVFRLGPWVESVQWCFWFFNRCSVFISVVVLAILGYTKTSLGPTPISEIRNLTRADARSLGCPVNDTNCFEPGDDAIIGVRFQPFPTNEEIAMMKANCSKRYVLLTLGLCVFSLLGFSSFWLGFWAPLLVCLRFRFFGLWFFFFVCFFWFRMYIE